MSCKDLIEELVPKCPKCKTHVRRNVGYYDTETKVYRNATYSADRYIAENELTAYKLECDNCKWICVSVIETATKLTDVI